MVVNAEVTNLAPKVIGLFNPARTPRVFNAGLTVIDAQDVVRPYLAESLPQLQHRILAGPPRWQDGDHLELRPGLTWHDGQPLTAEDFVFAHQIYTTAGLAVFEPRPQNFIERLAADDPLTVCIGWRSPFLDNGQGLDPLPRALLAESLTALQRDPAGQRGPFMSRRFWTTEYVGAGPFRLTAWEPGSHLEGEAFGGHVLSKPHIDRVQIRFIADENTLQGPQWVLRGRRRRAIPARCRVCRRRAPARAAAAYFDQHLTAWRGSTFNPAYCRPLWGAIRKPMPRFRA